MYLDPAFHVHSSPPGTLQIIKLDLQKLKNGAHYFRADKVVIKEDKLQIRLASAPIPSPRINFPIPIPIMFPSHAQVFLYNNRIMHYTVMYSLCFRYFFHQSAERANEYSAGAST